MVARPQGRKGSPAPVPTLSHLGDLCYTVSMTFSFGLLVLFCVALAVSGLGWYRFLYFISVGYGLSVAGCSIAMIIMYSDCLQPASFTLCFMLIVYGLRLSTFLIVRETRSASYKKALPELTKTSTPITFPFKLMIWLSVAVLYTMQVSPVLYRLDNVGRMLPTSLVWASVGGVVMACGIALESWADVQKFQAKRKNPGRFCDTGLYRIVRCPNYLGEIMFWTGCFISGIGSNQTAGQWIVSSCGYLCIVYIMFGGARRLEIRQNKNYGDDPEYQAYVERTPILIPLIPLHRLEPYTFLKG